MTGLVARYAVRTHTGLVREANEDDYLVVPEMGVYVVADGMGGHVAGKVASDLCVQTVEEYFATEAHRGALLADGEATGLTKDALELAESLLLANRRIHDASLSDRELTGMGTTAVGVRLFSGQIAVSHAGDSRCYLFREGQLQQVTVDHSLSNFLMQLGREAQAQYAAHAMANVIMRGLGLEPDIAVDTKEFPVRPGDRFLLCSDGLSDLVSDDEIAVGLSNPDINREELVDLLVQDALDAGGRDNITVLLLDIEASAVVTPTIDSAGETLEMPPVRDTFFEDEEAEDGENGATVEVQMQRDGVDPLAMTGASRRTQKGE
ncbi:MAG: serine/threonine protein phosphatase PrpC [Bradymonadia bacterium]|jgi:serine/threonine protein phosphatase PrpC